MTNRVSLNLITGFAISSSRTFPFMNCNFWIVCTVCFKNFASRKKKSNGPCAVRGPPISVQQVYDQPNRLRPTTYVDKFYVGHIRKCTSLSFTLLLPLILKVEFCVIISKTVRLKKKYAEHKICFLLNTAVARNTVRLSASQTLTYRQSLPPIFKKVV